MATTTITSTKSMTTTTT
ncbi:unnamed protein product, partial [Rotaria sordida]